MGKKSKPLEYRGQETTKGGVTQKGKDFLGEQNKVQPECGYRGGGKGLPRPRDCLGEGWGVE